MKKNVLASIFALTILFPVLAYGQWDYNQNAIDNIIDSRIDRRKTSERIRARKGGRRAAGTGKAGTRNPAPAPNDSAAAPYVSFLRDSYQNFHLDDASGYIVNFTFTGAGKTISKSYNYSYQNGLAEFGGIPAGTYTVRAEAVYNGRKYPVYLGSRDGSTTNPNGGDFAPAMKIQVKGEPDGYGATIMKTFPETLYTRVVE